MIKEGNSPIINETNDISQKKEEYSEKEITEKLLQGVGLDNDFVLCLLELGKQDELITNLEKFVGLNHQEIALKLIEAGYGYSVANHLEKFAGLNHQEIALKLIEAGKGDLVAYHLEKFAGLNHQEIALKLIEAGKGYSVADNLKKFTGLNEEIALKLIEAGYGDSVADHLEKFAGLNEEIALKLIEAGYGYSVANHLEKFVGLNYQEIALKLIEAGKGYSVADNLKKFTGLNHQEIALKLIEAGKGYSVANHLEKFTGLNEEIALKLIEAGKGDLVAYHLEKFAGLNHQEIALKLIEADKGYSVADNLKKFTGLNEEIALKLIEAGYGYSVADNLKKFTGLNYQEIALKLIEAGRGDLVADHLEKFAGLNHQEIALKLIEAGYGDSVADHLEKFAGLNHQKIALKLIEAGKGDTVADNLEKFAGLNHQKIALKLIEAGKGDTVADNLEKFQLSPQNFYQAVKEKYAEFITEVETKIPKLASQSSKSVELLLDILNIKDNLSKLEKNIAKNPFLLEALEDNPRYGSKLIIKYQEFDKIARNNIKQLFSNESEILKDNPNINKDSVEFRSLMQEKLVLYASNKEIIEELEKHNINAREWLSYGQEVYFTLGESEDVKFSDQIKTPINRIKEILNKYQNSIFNALLDYKKELQESFIPNPESEELKQKIEKLKAGITSETDKNKAQGMQRGLASLEAKQATLKPASVWSKVQSDIFRLKSMIDNIFKFYDACTTTETKIETTKDRKELIKEKDNLEKNKAQLRDNFKDFESFFESYETKLQELIIPSLGQERSEALIQEMKETIGEELNHYDTDKNTLKNIFNEKPENENKLNGREMKISISSRSTQDLYLGNYCPCCICIDSDYHGAESPIADYVTDLGMQNIVVYDEKTNAPVVTCWTFIGENKDKGEPIMVIDNIEANTNYTSNYPQQLEEVIFKYINDYAKSANIKTIIQGPHNNDLIVFPLGEVDRKLGDKYNRADGYFLEAEGGDEDDEDNNWEDNDNDNE